MEREFYHYGLEEEPDVTTVSKLNYVNFKVVGERFADGSDGLDYVQESALSDISAIYKEQKAKINENLKGSQQAFKSEDYKLAISYCNKIIKCCDDLERGIDKVPVDNNPIANLRRKQYKNYANYMREDAKIGIGEAKAKINGQNNK